MLDLHLLNLQPSNTMATGRSLLPLRQVLLASAQAFPSATIPSRFGWSIGIHIIYYNNLLSSWSMLLSRLKERDQGKRKHYWSKFFLAIQPTPCRGELLHPHRFNMVHLKMMGFPRSESPNSQVLILRWTMLNPSGAPSTSSKARRSRGRRRCQGLPNASAFEMPTKGAAANRWQKNQHHSPLKKQKPYDIRKQVKSVSAWVISSWFPLQFPKVRMTSERLVESYLAAIGFPFKTRMEHC